MSEESCATKSQRLIPYAFISKQKKYCETCYWMLKSLEMIERTSYLALIGEVAEWSKALPC